MLLQVVFLLFLFCSFFFLFSLSLSLSLSSNHFALPGERRKRRRGCCPSLSQFSAFPLVFLRLLSPRDRACRSEPRTNFSGSARRADKEGEAAASTFAERPRRFDGGNLSLSLSLSLLLSCPGITKMSNLVPAYSIAELYRSVVEDVVGRVRSEFVGEGVDE